MPQNGMAREQFFSELFQKHLMALTEERQEAIRKKIDNIMEMPEHFDFLSI